MEEEVTSAASTNPTRGSRVGGSTSTPHGGRRHVHARVHVRSASGCSRESLESPGVGTPSAFSVPDFPRNRSKASALEDAVSTKDEKTLYAYQEQPPAPVSPKPLQPHVHQVAAASTPSVTLEAAAAAAEMLPNPGGQRRMMAAGKTNPLHVWGQEMSFLKSHFFHPQRHRSNGAAKAQSDKSTGATEMRENLTHARVDLWSPRSAEGKGGQSVATAAAAKSEDALHVFGGQAPSPSRARRDAGESSGGQDSQQQGGKGTAGGGGSEGERLLPTSCASESMVRPKSAKANTWASLAVLRMRNMNALRAYSWDQRVFLPQGDGFMGTIFELLASPRVWEKVDWAIRGSAIAILPTLIVCLEPTTSQIFPLPTSVVFLAYWTSKPTLGAGLRETFTVLKAFIISLAFLCIVVAIQPGPKWLTILILFFSLSVGAFVAQQMRVMIAYCFASLLMQYVAHPETTGYKYIGDFYLTLFIGQGFAVGALLFPYIRWSSESARRYLIVMGDAISLSVHGACCSFWVESSLLERQLHVARLRQLRQTIEASMAKAEKGLSEMGYEPHSGVYTTRLKTRMAFLKNVFNIVQSMTLVIEQIAANPTLIETPMCRAFGERIRGELSVAAAAMDATLLRVVDLDDLVSAADMEAFRGAKARYEDAVSRVRDEVILSNEDYRTDNSDILLGFFLFSVEELMELISGFQDAARSQDNLRYFLMFPLRDLQSLWSAFVELHSAITLRHSITRRLKEGIKLSLSMALAAYIQTYALKSSSTNPILGVDTIAFLYRSTGGDSFQYGQGRLLGTVLGCLTGLFGVQLADGSRPVLYMCTLVLTFIGSYVQASPTCGAIGNGMSNGVISVVLQYTNRDGAIVRIEQNCFAVIIYFIVTSLVWPVRCQTKVKTGFDGCMRMGREVTDRLLRNLDLPHSAKAVSSDAMALLDEMQKKVSQQLQNLTGAQFEPTMDSAEFPEMAWCMLVSTQRKLVVTLLMMRHAYATFIISVHWVVLHRISPYTRQLSLLLYEAMEVYLLLMSKVTFVPTSELTRLRLGMMQCYDRIVAVYIETIQHELRDSDEDDNGGGFNDDKDMVDTAAKQAESAGQTTAPVTAGTCVPVFTPSGLVVDAGVRENRSFLDSTTGPKSHADLHARRRRSKLSKSANSERKKNDNGGGRVAYKLRPAERQLLREYMLGQHTASTLNASFFASATAMASDQETGGPSAALGNVDAGASVASHSIFNLNGIFFDRRASMLDPALLRNAGIVVQEPVHEEPKAKRSNSTVPATLSAHPSTMHSSRRPSFLNLRSSVTNVDGAVVIEVPGTEASAVTLPVFPLGLDRSLTTEGPLEGAVSAPPSLGHSCISVASLGGDERQQQQRQIPGLPALESLASIPPMDAAPATSKAELLAPRPSVLQSYTVVPTNASLAATQPSVVSAAANVQGVSGSGPHGSNAGGDAADQAAPSHGTLLSNSSLLMAATAGGARVVGGDVLALGRAALPGEQGVYDERSTAAESSPEFMLDGTPGVSAATASGGNAGTADGEGDWEGAREALGTLLSDRSTHPDNRTGRAAYCTASSQLGATLPTPTAAAAGVDAAADERAASSGTNTFPSNLDINGSFSRVGPAIPAALRSYVEGLAAHQQQQAPPPPALLGNTSYITISSNLPVMNRTLLGGGGFGSPAANPEASVRAGPTLTASAVAAASSSGGGVPAASTSVFPDAAPLAAAGGAASTEDACLRSFGVHNNTSDIADMLRSTHGTQSFNPVLLRLLQSDGEGGSEGAKNEYVLTNSDIHSLEAFLFGLRALITQVEDIERYLLEVVHGREMAKKL
ncbi:Fusaric acid resistance-like family protein [Leishmania donovani]|uniref:Fusaric acid resistance-like family protein n=1 Tax=Leishmania donovani TaxID=5661 RepID=A0A504X9F3_LEIDO|nr:Fusaric acid resistance-like family protein [Leishmania donovani]